jgi:oxygen-independent coproporphyrinogen-3 oxidase
VDSSAAEGHAPVSRAGAYIHVPYCAHRCTYCSFVALTDRSTEEDYFEALLREIGARRAEVSGPLDTVYFGGGTPSFVATSHLEAVVGQIQSVFGLDASAEVTAEANPDDLTSEKFDELAALGVNRLSLGVQSLVDEELVWLERRHGAEAGQKAVSEAVRRFGNVSADLMIGIPEQTRGTLLETARRLVELGIRHISVYLLEMEKAPRLVKLKEEQPGLFPDDEEMADRWLAVDDFFSSKGLMRYEFSNWARPGFESRHNLKYWQRAPTIGFGVSAHSFDGRVRRANTGSTSEYIRRIRDSGMAIVSETAIEGFEQEKEEMMLGLRLRDGVPENRFNAVLARLDRLDSDDLRSALEAGLLERVEGHVRLTRDGVLVSNEIFSALV